MTIAYLLPVVLGNPYSGHQETSLYIEPYSSELKPEFTSIAFVTTTGLDAPSVMIYVNGSLLSSNEYLVSTDSSGAILFKPNLQFSDVVASYDFATTAEQLAVDILELMPAFIAVLAVFLGSDSLIREFSERTGFITFTTPVKRETIMLGKFAASLIGGAVALLIFYAVLAGLSYFTLGAVATYLPLSLGFALLYSSSCLAISFLIGSTSRGIAPSVVVSFALLLLILPAIQMAGEAAGSNMWFVPTHAAGVIKYSVQFEHYPQDVAQGGTPIFYPQLGLSAAVMIGYSLVSLLTCGYLFSRREMKD